MNTNIVFWVDVYSQAKAINCVGLYYDTSLRCVDHLSVHAALYLALWTWSLWWHYDEQISVILLIWAQSLNSHRITEICAKGEKTFLSHQSVTLCLYSAILCFSGAFLFFLQKSSAVWLQSDSNNYFSDCIGLLFRPSSSSELFHDFPCP